MTLEELSAIMAYLRERVQLGPKKAKDPVLIEFQGPTKQEMVGAGLNAEGVELILSAPWWEEMVADIIETPDFCESDDSPQQVLEYARDVVSDYVQKRVSLKAD
ncbi:MAG: hypothetical protein AMJ54_06615 [Deltaproteobacteria bacterium SG8_13]|nr:MAG: hypothetical protein AMJ54_06615 [Deltaproteobacteria bacterium SG8_13]